MTDEAVEEKINRRLKTDEEKAKDQQALADGYNRLIGAVDNFFEHYGHCEGDYGDIGMRHYDRLKDARDRFRGPRDRAQETHVAEDWTDMSKEDIRTTTSSHWYERHD